MITFNGKSSEEFNLHLLRSVTFDSPSRNLESRKILGRDGEIMVGDGTLNNVKKSFPFVLKDDAQDVAQSISDISNWLKSDGLWHDLEFEGDAEYVYQAICLNEYNFERVVEYYGKGTIDFIIKPYKFLKTGLTERILDESITNPLGRSSKPKLTIKGSGNITINIGNSALTLKNIDDGVIVDSLYQTVTTLNGQAQAWDKVTSYPLPTIAPGRQSVTTTGNVTEIKIIPRWEAIV